MVFYHTSGNVKILRNILIDYGTSNELTPIEYMKIYIDKRPEEIDDAKLTWIVKTFLGIRKHDKFLNAVSTHLSEELSKEAQDYFKILLHAIIFQIGSNEWQNLYKCLFNLSKSLLSTFTNFLGNNEVLTFISQVAQIDYDPFFITNKIITPLFTWQPYISELGHSYVEYVQKLESRKIKPKTVPIQLNVLNRKNKETSLPKPVTPATPPNSMKVRNFKKMLTKSAIDIKLKHSHEKNKQKAAHLLNDVKNADYHFAQDRSEEHYRKLSVIRDEIENEYIKPLPKQKQKLFMKYNPPSVKETATTLKRMNKRVQLDEKNEIKWLEDLMKSCKAAAVNIEELLEYDREEAEKERLYDMERKHLEGQISHEEALIAKKKLIEENKKKYEEFLKEKESWNEEIDYWKKIEMEKNRKQIENLSILELNLRQAKTEVIEKNKTIAANIKKESELRLEEATKKKQEELERRVNMIKEIKILAMIAKKAKVPKVIDLTETSGFGFLCEMSIAELQERLSSMKMCIKEEIENKKKIIREEKMAAEKNLEQVKDSIKTYMRERADMKKNIKKSTVRLDNSASKELNNLKKILSEKKKLRLQLTN